MAYTYNIKIMLHLQQCYLIKKFKSIRSYILKILEVCLLVQLKWNSMTHEHYHKKNNLKLKPSMHTQEMLMLRMAWPAHWSSDKGSPHDSGQNQSIHNAYNQPSQYHCFPFQKPTKTSLRIYLSASTSYTNKWTRSPQKSVKLTISTDSVS